MDLITWFRNLWTAFWDLLGGMNFFDGMEFRDLFVSFLVMSAVLGFVFKKFAPSGD